MEKVVMDTDSLKSVGEDIKSISKDYKNLMDEVYNKIKSIPDAGIWVSDNTDNSANKFIETALRDIQNNKELSNSIESLGDIICKYGSTIQQISDNKFEESLWEK